MSLLFTSCNKFVPPHAGELFLANLGNLHSEPVCPPYGELFLVSLLFTSCHKFVPARGRYFQSTGYFTLDLRFVPHRELFRFDGYSEKVLWFVPYTRELFYSFLKTASNLRSLSPARGSYSKQMAEMVKYNQFVPPHGELFLKMKLNVRILKVCPLQRELFRQRP